MDEFRIVHRGVSDCVNYGEKPRDSGFAEDEIENPLKHPVAVELVYATPSKEDGKKHCNNSVAHWEFSFNPLNLSTMP